MIPTYRLFFCSDEMHQNQRAQHWTQTYVGTIILDSFLTYPES